MLQIMGCSLTMGMEEESYLMIHIALILELQNHKTDYLQIFGSE